MANAKISALASAGALTGGELLALVQGGETRKIDLDALAAHVAALVPPVRVYATLQAVITAITAGELPNGASWTIAWTGDAYIPDGAVLGLVWGGKPYWRGLLPSPYLGTTLTALTGAYTLDGAGHPILTATGDGTSTDTLDLGFTAGAFAQIRLAARYTSGVPTGTGIGAPSLFVGKQGSEATNNLTAGLTYFGGWQVFGTGISNPFSALSPAPDFTAGLPFTVGLNIWRHPTLANPRGVAIGQHSANALQLYDAGGSVDLGMGDWRSNLSLTPRVRLRDVGVPATLIYTGLEIML